MRVADWIVFLCVFAAAVSGQERVDVVFQITQTTVVGQSIFVLGDLPELGANDVRLAVKLEPSGYPVWKAAVSLPAGREYTYRFYRRDDGPGRLGDASNGVAIGLVVSASTPIPAPPLSPAGKAVVYHSGLDRPILHWRHDAGGYLDVPMTPIGPGRGEVAGEYRWIAWDVSLARRRVEFYFTNEAGGERAPASGTYATGLDAPLVQDGQVYSYIPAAAVSPARRDYNSASPPGINSANLGGEFRRYRVVLPRGYDEHVERRYPVLYMHDGQNVFEVGPFGSWSAFPTLEAMTRSGTMRETIVVGVDNTSNRFANYVPADDGGQAHNYANFLRLELKPLIDAQYRTLAGPEETGAIGSSLGGVVSLFLGWDYTSVWKRIGAMSGSWQLPGFPARVRSQASRDFRLYLDSGDAGASSDNYWPTFNLRDHFLSRVGSERYELEGSLRHTVGFGHQHNEAAWAARLPKALEYLFPAREGEGELLGLASGALFDVNGDGAVDVEDLHAQQASGEDLNLDGVVDEWDTVALAAWLRRHEGREMAGERR